MKSRIEQADLEHLEAFPGEQKALVMRKIMSLLPAERVVLDGDNDFEKTVLKLRREGYGLIDLQPLEQAFSCVWYRRSKALFRRADVAMLLWEMQNPGALTTVLTWRI
ncbi:MAG: hypothetical protein HYX46_03400 [Betaproteobacteria bacterium]|nr:hypothetical protein [Betaproteobacteria bacterium]